jgi:hypothetical protein
VPASGGQAPSLFVVVEQGQGGDLDAVVDKDRQANGRPGYQSTIDQPVSLTDGTAAHILGYVITDPESGVQHRDMGLVVVYGNLTLHVIGQGSTQNWASDGATIAQMLHTLTVNP